MLEVSHFELVYKPQSPVPPADTVLQGYFLEISNLEDEEYLFTLDFVTSSISDPDRSLFSNTVIFVDTPSVNNGTGVYALTGGPTAASFSLGRAFAIPAKGTALVAMLPADPFSMPGVVVTPNFECRGFVRLRLPAVRRRNPFAFPRLEAQSKHPVKVMLTPQFRATYLSSTGVINDQTQSAVPTSTGRAVNELPPDQPKPIRLSGLVAEQGLSTIIAEELMQAGPSPEVLAVLLGQVDADPKELEAFNAILDKSGVNLSLTARTAGER